MTVEEIKAYCKNKPKATEDFPEEELLNMIDLAYNTVFSKFSKKIQKQICEDNMDRKNL